VQRGIPFEMRLPVREPVVINTLTTEQLNAELEKGYDSAIAGRHRSLNDVVTDMERDYGI